jgi:hypothetical protein
MERKSFSFWARAVWKQLSEELGGDYLSHIDWHNDRIISRVDDWTVTVDLHQRYDPDQIFTRIHAPYFSADGFHFKVYHQGFAEVIAKLLSIKGAPHFSLEDIEIGEPVLDNMFVIQATNSVEIKQLLSNRKISHGLKTEPNVLLLAEHLPKYPEDVDVLTLEVPGRVDTLSRLERIFELFSEVLHTMCHLGSAYEDDPNIILNH